MAGDLSRHERDPDYLFNAERAEKDMFGERPWLFGQIARVDGAVGGMALWHHAYDGSYAARGAYIASLWVDPPYRRIGVATKLIASVVARIRTEGGTYLWWASKPRNRRAHATYAAWGAISERVMAHALIMDRFEDMVELAEKDTR